MVTAPGNRLRSLPVLDRPWHLLDAASGSFPAHLPGHDLGVRCRPRFAPTISGPASSPPVSFRPEWSMFESEGRRFHRIPHSPERQHCHAQLGLASNRLCRSAHLWRIVAAPPGACPGMAPPATALAPVRSDARSVRRRVKVLTSAPKLSFASRPRRDGLQGASGRESTSQNKVKKRQFMRFPANFPEISRSIGDVGWQCWSLIGAAVYGR